MGVFLRQVALACIVVSLLPQVAAAAVALRVHLDHGAEHGHSTRFGSVIPALHGHAHSDDTPDHDHPLTLPASGSVASHERGTLPLALAVGCGGACTSWALADVRASDEHRENQRPAQAIPSVLRI